MTFTTPNGIRYPDDPSALADIIQFFKDMAEDVDEKFVPNWQNTVSMSGALTARSFVSSNGGTTQSATVLQTGPNADAFTFYDDNLRVDGSAGRRLWLAGANNTDVAIRTRSDSENLNRISLRATTLDLNGAVTINGTLNITGTRTTTWRAEADHILAASKTTWNAVPGTTGFTFVAPPSASVTIGFGAMLPTSQYTAQLTYAVRTGSTIGSGSTVMAVDPGPWDPKVQPPPHSVAANGASGGGQQYVSVYTAFMLTGSAGGGSNPSQILGLVPGNTYNVKPYYINQNSIDLKLYRMYFIVTPDL